MFEVGEWAVLRHKDGGRLFQVHAVDGDRVTERHSIPSQQQYVQPDHMTNLLKVKDRDDAIRAVAVLDFVQAQYRSDVLMAERARAERFRYVTIHFEFIPEEVPL